MADTVALVDMAMMPSASPPAVAADAAGGDNDGVPAESLLPPDAWHHIFSLLSPKDVRQNAEGRCGRGERVKRVVC